MKLIIYTDGGVSGNPGPSGLGVVIYNQDKQILGKYSKFLNRATNNQAEYQAVLMALQKAKELGAKEIDVFLDSELVQQQLSGKYKVQSRDLQTWFVKIWNLQQSFTKIKFVHVRRNDNRRTDLLVNQAISKAGF